MPLFQLHVLSIFEDIEKQENLSFFKYLGTSYHNLVFQVNYICCINLNGKKKQKIDT